MTDLFASLALPRGPALANRFALAPLTNKQSHIDGTLSDDEYRWLTMRAEGGFALTITCAAHVQAGGKAFEGQLGIFSDAHLPGLSRLAGAIKAAGSVAAVQLHHGGMRTLTDPVAPSDEPGTGAHGLTLAEVEQVRDDFIAAARRAEAAGFDGVEIHGAHGYLLCEFLSPTINRRDDHYGGNIENRRRILDEIVTGIRATCGPDFQIGLRLSPERFGQVLAESIAVAGHFLAGGQLDYLDLSLWDVRKEPVEEGFRGRTLLSCFTGLPRGRTAIAVAGAVRDALEARWCLDNGADFVMVGKGAIVTHDLPRRLETNIGYSPPAMPVSAEHLAAEGLSPGFISYMRTFKGFVV
ncbi:MAG: NADH:flavin oxidoreductase [Sphingobium sp.]